MHFMPTVSHQVQAVLYLDFLGFAAMTMNNEETPVYIPPFETGNWQDDYGAGAPAFWTEKRHIAYNLLIFNRKLEQLLRVAARQGPLQAALFSDGAFVVMPDLAKLAVLAIQVMRTCILSGLPVRMGLAL